MPQQSGARNPYAASSLKPICRIIAHMDGYGSLDDAELYVQYGIDSKVATYLDVRIAAAMIIKSDEYKTTLHHIIRELIRGSSAPAVTRTDLHENVALANRNHVSSENMLIRRVDADKMQQETAETAQYEAKLIEKFLTCKLTTDMVGYSSKTINLTDLLHVSETSKELAMWRRTKEADAIIQALSNKTGIPVDELYYTKPGLNGGTWAHVHIAIQVAQWISPVFAIEVSEFIERMMRGDLTLVSDVIDRHDAINDTKTNMVSIAPGTADQIRQTTIATTIAGVNDDEQARRNASQKMRNDELLARAIDCSSLLPPSILYKDEPLESGARLLNINAVDNAMYERAIIPLSAGMITARDLPDRRHLEEAMWNLIVLYHNDAAKSQNSMAQMATRDREEGEERLTKQQLREAVTYLTNQLNTLATAHDMRKYVELLTSQKWLDDIEARVDTLTSRAGRIGGQEARDIQSYLLAAHQNARVMAGEFVSAVSRILDPFNPCDSHSSMRFVGTINSHMAAVGLDMRPYFESRAAIDALHNIRAILRADLSTMAFTPTLVNPVNMFLNRKGDTSLYYKSVSDELGLMGSQEALAREYESFVAPYDTEADDGIFRLASEGIAPTTKPKKSGRKMAAAAADDSKLGSDEIVASAKSMTAAQRAAISTMISDIVNRNPLIIAPTGNNSVINVYIGEYGFAPYITPVPHRREQELYVYLTAGEFRDPTLYHLHSCGTVYLKTGAADQILANTVRPVISKYPCDQSAAPVGFGFIITPLLNNPGYHHRPIRVMTRILGDAVSHVVMPTDLQMNTWRVFTLAEIMADYRE